MINSLLKSPDNLVLVIKKFLYTFIITSFPFRFPGDLQLFIFSDQVLMDILEMKSISSVLRDILHVTIDIVDCLTTIGEVFAETRAVDEGEVRLDFRINVEPDIDKVVELTKMIFMDVWSIFLGRGL